MRFGGGQDEAGVRGRLFQRLEQRVEGAVGEHVHFVDDVDLVAALAGAKADLVAQFADIVDAVVGGSVDLDQVDHAPFGDGDAGGALLQGRSASGALQLSALARMRAELVLPVPRGPAKR